MPLSINLADDNSFFCYAKYLHKDHLGSIQAYSDDSGKLIQELSYDSWGRRRNPANWTYYTSLTDANAMHSRGFTGHEHLDAFEMINMDGRMYDPVLGRFMSPDPTVQAADYTQGLNRYSYCLNNPLSLIDPSGYSWFSKNWKCLAASAVGIVVTAVSAGIGSGVAGVMIAGALGGAAAGLSGALLNGADFGQIVKATFTGGFWGAASGFLAYGSGGGQFLERLFKHSFSQAWMEGIKGGDMKHGFLVGLASASGGTAITKYGDGIGKVGKIAANAVLAGTVSEIGGGKFANGAVTGAFSMLFNDLMHGNSNLKSYVKKMFPGRLPKGVEVTFDLYDGEGGETEGSYMSPGAPVSVKISKSLWKSRNGDNRLLIDCIDHELVHVDDYASGRAFRYFDAYGKLDLMHNIMEYKAYSENLWYNLNMRPEENRINVDYYRAQMNFYGKEVPSDWKKY